MDSSTPDSVSILHVDDEPGFADMAAGFLEREDDRFTVETARGASEGLDRLSEGGFDCVVSDYDMPGQDGIGLLEAVREEHPDLPFILFTGDGSEEVASEAIANGVTDYLRKGSETRQYAVLANKISNAVERYRAERERERQRSRFEALFRTLPEPTAILSGSDGPFIKEINPAFEDAFGYDADAVRGEDLTELIVPEEHLDEARRIDDDATEGEVLRREVERETAAGDRRDFLMVATGEVSGTETDPEGYVIYVDITDRKEHERELERYERIVEAMGEAVYVNDAEGRMVEVNRRMEELTGYDRSELLGEHVSVLLDEEDIAKGERTIRELLESEEMAVGTYEETIHTADGGTVRCEVRQALLPAEDGPLRGTVGTLRDITEHRERERELERYETIVETVGDSVYTLDADGRYTFVNDAFVEETGYAREDVLGEHVSLTLPEGDIERSREIIQDLLACDGRDTAILEAERITAGGEHVPIEIHIGLLPPDGDGGFRGTAGVARDISERKERERALAALHDVGLELSASGTVDEICRLTVEASEDILDFDRSVMAIEEDGLLEIRAMSEQMSPELSTTMSAEEGLAGKSYRSGEAFLVDDLGECGEAKPQGPYRSGLSLPVGAHGNFQAVAERPGAFDEDDLALAQLLVDRANSALDRIRHEQELRRRNERLDRFASVVSHDLRSPLNVARGRLELAREECDSDHLDGVADALDRSQGLIDDILALAREGDRANDIEPVVLADTLERCWRNVATAEATLVAETDRTIRADRDRLKRLLENLIRNAIEHGGEDVTVTVCDLDDGFYLEDDGPGIPGDEREQVFESGYSTSEKGTGFGLAIVEEIAEAHGWGVTVTDGEDGGARVEVTGLES